MGWEHSRHHLILPHCESCSAVPVYRQKDEEEESMCTAVMHKLSVFSFVTIVTVKSLSAKRFLTQYDK